MVEHGGNLDSAIARFGGQRSNWIDLSTGINPHAYDVPRVARHCWTDLPDEGASLALQSVAAAAYLTKLRCLPLAGAQQAIQLYPRCKSVGLARILEPTYNEHRLQLHALGWQVEGASSLSALAGASIAVVVNPNNPDGRYHSASDLLSLSKSVDLLVVDESFADPCPELSLCPHVTPEHDNILILRSFGKFYGLAGLRLGFAIGSETLLAPLEKLAGSWPVSGPALAIGAQALADNDWAEAMRVRLLRDADRLDGAAQRAGWRLHGGTSLFRLYEVDGAKNWQERFGQHHIWCRRFSYAKNWLRLGLPPADGWDRLEVALASIPLSGKGK